MNETPEAYANAFPDRLMAFAEDHQVVRMDIRREYAPLLASDLFRGAVLLDRFTGPFEGTVAHALMEADTGEASIAITVPAHLARIMAMQVRAGGQARRHIQ